MSTRIRIAAVSMVACAALAAVGPGARYIEEIAVGGGFGDPVDGGAEIDRTGAIATDGAVVARSGAAFGRPEGAQSVAVTAGPGAAAAIALHENNALNGGRLWYDGAANTLRLGTHNNHATPTAALSIPQGSTSVQIAGGLSFSAGPSLTNSGANLVVNVPGGAEARFSVAATERYRMTAADFHGRNAENLGSATHPWGAIHAASLDLSGGLEAAGGEVVAGADSSARGIVRIWDGSGGNAPGAIAMASPNGTVWHLFVEDDGTVKVSSGLPASNGDGVAIGAQF